MRKKGLSNEEIAQICRGLSVLLHAGLSHGDSLCFMAEEEQGTKQEMMLQLGKMVDEGCSFSQALESLECFPAYVAGLIKVGEASGHLEEALEALAAYYEGQARLTRQLKNTLTYPMILMFLMVIVIGILLTKVLPVFEEVYESLGVSVSGMGKGVLLAGKVLEAFLPVLCVMLLLVIGAILCFAKNENFRNRIMLRYRRKFGNRGIAKSINTAHFAQALAMGLKSGMVIEEAVALAGVLLKDVPEARSGCTQCEEKIKAGEPLGKSLKETGILPTSACRMLELGIRSGNGDGVMCGIAERLMEEAENETIAMVSKIEPVMVTITSLLVGIILLSVMMPLINVLAAIG